MEAFEAADDGTEYVITKYRKSNVNLRTQFQKIIKRAGLKPWPKLFQNLRSTRETELMESWPEHVVCKWIGNTKAVAMESYLQVTNEHFKKAAQNPAHQMAMAQNPAQQPSADQCNDSQDNRTDDDENAVLQNSACGCDGMQSESMGRAGFEPA